MPLKSALLALCVFVFSCSGVPRAVETKGPAQHVVIISVDGLRPDAIEKAGATHLQDLIRKGAYCAIAETIRPSVTLPSHVAMLTGLDFQRHGVVWNNYREGRVQHPTVFSVSAKAGLSTAILFSKDKFHYVSDPAYTHWIYGSPVPKKIPLVEDYTDPKFHEKQEVSRKKRDALPVPTKPRILRPEELGTSAEVLSWVFAEEWPKHACNLTFVHIREADDAGHHYGWMTPPYLEAVRRADAAVGVIVETLKRAGRLEKTAVIVTADHGGSGRDHFERATPDLPNNVVIPWICAGPGVKPGTKIDRVIRTYDTAPTALALLGLAPPEGIDGKAVTEVLK